MRPFYETPELRWQAMEDDFKADSAGRNRLADIEYSLKGEDNAPTNSCWEYINLVLPQLIYQNPSLAIDSRIPGEPVFEALGLRYALESLMAQQRWNFVWEQAFADALAWRGVTMVSTETVSAPHFLHGREVIDWRGEKRKVERGEKFSVPRLYYIPPCDFFSDSTSTTTQTARRMGHRWSDSISRLKAKADRDDSYIKGAIERFQGRKGKDDLVVVRQMYVPNYLDPEAVSAYDGDEKPGEDDLHHGTIYTMIEGGNGAGIDLKKPRVYRGPACGPYQLYECVPLPNRKHRTAPLDAVWKQINRDARVGEACTAAGEAYKRIVVATQEMARALRNVGQDGIAELGVAKELLEQAAEEVEIGGIPNELAEFYAFTREAVDRTLGISDTQRGLASKDTTATAESIADKSTDIKIGMIRTQLHRQAEEACYVAGWHILHGDDFVQVLPDEARQEGLAMAKKMGIPLEPEQVDAPDPEAVTVYGGGASLSDDPNRAYDAYMVKIAPMSMERTSEHMQQRRVLEAGNLVMQAVQLRAADPSFDAKRFLNDQGAKVNQPGLGDYLGAAPQQGAPGAPGAVAASTPATMQGAVR